jgi:hypothetical protein
MSNRSDSLAFATTALLAVSCLLAGVMPIVAIAAGKPDVTGVPIWWWLWVPASLTNFVCTVVSLTLTWQWWARRGETHVDELNKSLTDAMHIVRQQGAQLSAVSDENERLRNPTPKG